MAAPGDCGSTGRCWRRLREETQARLMSIHFSQRSPPPAYCADVTKRAWAPGGFGIAVWASLKAVTSGRKRTMSSKVPGRGGVSGGLGQGAFEGWAGWPILGTGVLRAAARHPRQRCWRSTPGEAAQVSDWVRRISLRMRWQVGIMRQCRYTAYVLIWDGTGPKEACEYWVSASARIL